MAVTYEYSDHASKIIKELNQLGADGSLCDGILKASDEQTFPVHRSVLVAASPYFKAMFISGFKEATTTKEMPIELPTVTSKGLGRVLDCLYSGKLELSNEFVYDVLPIAHMLQLTSILGSCEEFLIQEMNVQTCIRNVLLADEYQLHEIASAAKSFILRNFVKVSSTKDFVEITYEQPYKYLREERLTGKEIEIYRAVKKWLDHKPERRQYQSGIMSLINLQAIPAELIADEVMQDELLMKNKECYQMAVSAMKYHSSTSVFTQPFRSPAALRGEDAVVIIETGGAEDFKTKDVAQIEIYSKSDVLSEVNEGFSLSCHSVPLKYKLAHESCSTVTVKNFLFLFATDSDTFTSVTQRFDGSSGVWIDLAPVPMQGTCGTTATCVNNTIFLVGGRRITELSRYKLDSSAEIGDDIFSYVIARNEWKRQANCPSKLAYHAACSDENHVYVVGGYISDNSNGNSVQLSKKCYAYSVKANIWLYKACTNYARADATLEAIDGKLFVIGGGDYHLNSIVVSSIEMYDILQNQWTIVEKAPGFPYYAASSFVEGTNIFLLGGFSGDSDTSSKCVSVFDSKSKKICVLKQKFRRAIWDIVCCVLKLQHVKLYEM